MGKYKIPDLPELPSDDELGITKRDRERYKDVGPGEGEMSKHELLALLGETPSSAPGGRGGRPDATGGPTPGGGAPRADAGAAPRRRLSRGPVTAVLLALMAVASSSRMSLPRPVDANAPDTAFSSARAMATVSEIARAPHPTGSPDHARVRGYLLERLRALGVEPEVQTTTSVIERGPAARAATVRNLMARIPGTASTGAVLITAHYDSRELAPGAGDDGAGVATVIEAVRALRAGAPVRNDIIVLITDAEELGLLGARAFVAEHPWLADVSVVLSFEMRGSGGASIMFETNDQNGWVVRSLAAFDPKPFANSLAYEVYETLPNDTDFTPFKDAGKQGLNFAAIGRGHVYHQSTDTPENLSEATLQHHGLRAVAALRWLGGADLASVHAPNVVYFTVPLVGLIVYRPVWVLPIAGGLLLAMALLVFLAIRRQARPVGTLVGLGVALLEGALAFGAGVGLLRATARFHPEAGSLSAALYHGEAWYVLGLAGAVFVVVSSMHGLGRRWLRTDELVLGALVIPLIAAIWLSFTAPMGAMNIQWPVAAAILSTSGLVLLGSAASGVLPWILALLLALPVVVLLTPVIELLWLTLTLGQAPLLAVLMTMALWLCLPALEALRQPNKWWAPAAGLVVAGGGFMLGNLSSRPSPARPAPSTLSYAYEHGTRSGLWVTDASADPVVDSAAIAWAAAPVGSSFAGARDLTAFGYEGDYLVAEAPMFAAPLPHAVLLRDSAEGASRRVALGVRSTVRAEMIRFQVDRRAGTRLLAINARTLSSSDSLEWAEHWGEPDSLVVLDLAVPLGAPIGLHIVEHLLRPGEVVVADVFRRPPELAPDVSAMSDRAVLRSSVDLALAASTPAVSPP